MYDLETELPFPLVGTLRSISLSWSARRLGIRWTLYAKFEKYPLEITEQSIHCESLYSLRNILTSTS